MSALPHNYRDRVYAGWLGKCAGVRLGAPVENWTAAEIAANLGEVTDFLPLPPGKVFKPDDDTAVPLVLIRALEDYGPAVTAAEFGEALLNYVADGRGTFWWGGYGVSSEHTAYANLAGGIPAPASGSSLLNGRALAEQIGGQIFSDIWGLVAPNQPALAADLAERASRVTHDGEAVLGGRFIAGLVSRAFDTAGPAALVQAGLALIPETSEYARVVRAVRDFHRSAPEDWRAAYQFLLREFGYDRYAGAVPIIPNAGVVALALLYSGGDFTRGIQIATNAGWDTDCNAGNVGAILGVAAGLDGIGARWRTPMNDEVVAASLAGCRNLWDLPACADLFARLGARLAGAPAPEPLPRYHFDYPGATHGFRSEARLAEIVGLSQAAGPALAGRGALRVAVRDLKKKGEARVWLRTLYRPAELSANYYGASFSPKLYPGQTLTARVRVPAEASAGLTAALFARDDYTRAEHQAPGAALTPGEWQTISYALPRLENALLSDVGLVLRTTGEAWSGHLLLDMLDWSGPASFATDFSRERPEYGAISGWTCLRGYWRLEAGAYHGSGPGVNETYTGDDRWQDLALSVDLVPLAGEHHTVNVRVQGARRSYAVGLAPHGRLAIYKNAGGYQLMAEAPLLWRLGQRYRLRVQAAGPALVVAVDEQECLRWTDQAAPYLRGQVGLSNAAGSHTRYERVAVG
jgi:ADP-ribosylglycohydrolase